MRPILTIMVELLYKGVGGVLRVLISPDEYNKMAPDSLEPTSVIATSSACQQPARVSIFDDCSADEQSKKIRSLFDRIESSNLLCTLKLTHYFEPRNYYRRSLLVLKLGYSRFEPITFCLNLHRILYHYRIFIIISFCYLLGQLEQLETKEFNPTATISSDESFTFAYNGSFLQIDAGREWPFNSKREISFKFKTKSPHGLLIYQTFDHNKLARDEEQENLDPVPPRPPSAAKPTDNSQSKLPPELQSPSIRQQDDERSGERLIKSEKRRSIRSAPNEHSLGLKHRIRASRDSLLAVELPLTSNTITATASERLVNSLFSASPAAAINGNSPPNPSRASMTAQTSARDNSILAASSASLMSSKESNTASRNHRILTSLASGTEASNNRANYGAGRAADNTDGQTILSSSTIGSLSASLYELYLKLENGRLKIMYEFGSRLNQTYCGKGLNDDRWHKVDLKVDPELNQMILVLDQTITVEIVLSQLLQEDESVRRNELVFTNSILYLGGLNNNASIVKNVKQRLYMAQFIGCMGQILIKTDQHTESALQPVNIDNAILVKRGCLNRCDTNNYCLHKSTCVNYYSHTKCDCLGTNYEDIYCWQDRLTTLSMLGYSTLVYRIYDWRDRHHSSINRLSLQFKTLAPDSILFFAYGDLSAQNFRNLMNSIPQPMPQAQTSYSVSQVNLSSPLTISHRPTIHPPQSNSNYLAVSLSNGSLVVEVNFGDQPILLSNILYDKTMSKSGSNKSTAVPKILNDGIWHNITIAHSNKQLFLQIDNNSIAHNIAGKNNYLYFDPSIYIGAVPNILLNETRTLTKPLNLRHKFVGCLRSVYFNQHNILLALKQGSTMVEYRDILGKPRLDTCIAHESNSLPLTMRSGKSYLTFQLATNSQMSQSAAIKQDPEFKSVENSNGPQLLANPSMNSSRKLTKIEFEYKTSLKTHFLAGGHLRDLSYHDIGGFWTLHARDECQLYFTISSGLTFEPEQVIKLDPKNMRCDPSTWFGISIALISGDKTLNISRYSIDQATDGVVCQNYGLSNQSYTLKSSIELLHQVQLGGDLAKFGESSSVPFTGCIRKIKINENSFDSRDFVSNTALSPSTANLYQYNSTINNLGISQSDVISNRIAQGYVTLDSCNLVNPCLSFNPCKNGGICKINELGEPDCDCSKTGYTGKRCHFSIYKQSCQDLHLSGQRKSSHYLIDLDRNGALKPIRVRCNMEDGNIETVLTHNLPAEFLIRRSRTKDVYLDITYIAFHHLYTGDGFYVQDDNELQARTNQDQVLQRLIGQSIECKQNFRYECRSSPIELGNRTWMEVPYPKTHKLASLDGTGQSRCPCVTSEKKCLDPTKNCNCDSGQPMWSDDSNELAGLENVGITRIVLLQQNLDSTDGQHKLDLLTTESQTRLTLGDLKCFGTRRFESQHEITFKTNDAYIEVPGWRRGDISFSFRTASSPPAIVLYQLATSRNHGYFRLTLISDTRLLFEFIVNRRPRKLFLTSTHNLNNGQWQQVFIEYDPVNLRLSVNDDSAIVDLDTNDYLGTFEGPLFIGGAPSKYLLGDMSKRNGFTGCIRGLNIDGKSIDLKSYLSPSMPTVISGCQPSCTKNLCQNGGKCIEYWGSYECDCSNPIAHSGNNCEINLNTNSITFVTPESHYVQSYDDSQSYPPYLIKSMLLNIRTYQETALIFYASDSLNNFVQLHKNGSSLVLTFNSNSTIVIAQVPIDSDQVSDLTISNPSIASTVSPTDSNSSPPPSNQSATMNMQSNTPAQRKQVSSVSQSVNISLGYSIIDKSIKVSNTSGSGQPIQLKIERHRLRTTFYVNNNFLVVEKPMIFLTNYSQNPWINPELELVRPIRLKSGAKIYSRMFLANIDEYFNTRLPGFTGCIQGLSIDNQLFDFNRAHLTGDLKGEYKIGCKMRCDSFPCKNQGTCIENWKEDRIQCRCDSTSYVGRLCDEDIAAIFNGHSSYFLYHLSKKFAMQPNLQSTTVTNPSNGSLKRTVPETIVNVEPIAVDKQEEKIPRRVDIGDLINFFEISLAFSTDGNQSLDKHGASVQVLVLITRANSSRYFFLGLTPDGSLLIQEDYGNSMSLSRLIKRQDHPYNDGFRHMVKYSRYNQTIQIAVDYQTYLPTMSVINTNHASKYSKHSLILVGTATTELYDESHLVSNYSGCISNLLIKINDINIEPLSEAFGHNLETIDVNGTRGEVETVENNDALDDKKIPLSATARQSARLMNFEDTYGFKSLKPEDQFAQSKTLSVINKQSGKEALDDIGTIIARDVEQGKCAAFKRVETSEKHSVNEPKYTPLLEPRPVYMDPPRVKPYARVDPVPTSVTSSEGYNVLFYGSLAILLAASLSTIIYVYILQARYKSEKFRCETPFFHKRGEHGSELPSNAATTSTGDR